MRRRQGLAVVAFHWNPADFYRATPHEFWAAYEVYEQMNAAPEGDGAK